MQNTSMSIYPNPKQQFVGVMLALFLAIFANSILFIKEEPGSMTYFLFFLLAAPFSIWLFVYVLRDFISKNPFFILEKTGITYKVSPSKMSFRKWEDIEAWEIIQAGELDPKPIMLVIHLKNAAEKRPKQNRIQKYFAKEREKVYGSPFAFSLSNCEISVPDCIKTINKFLEENKQPDYLQIYPQETDLLMYQHIATPIFVSFVGIPSMFAGLWVLYEGIEGVAAAMVCLSFGGLLMGILLNFFFNKNIRFIYSKKQKNSSMQKEHEKLIAEMGKKYDF